MKKYYMYLLVVPILLLVACDKSLDTITPDFDVESYTVTDGLDSLGNPVKNVAFKLGGDAKVISFWSGEFGHDYDYREGRIVDYNSLDMSFSTTIQFGTQPNQLSVWASTDFNGKYTAEDVNAASWIDITNRFELANVVGSTVPLSSGIRNIGDLKVEGKPLYIGFKYVTLPQTVAGVQNTWRIRDFLITGKTDTETRTIGEHTGAEWVIVNDGDIIDPNRSAVESATVVMLRGNNINTEVKTTSWAITKGFNINSSNVGPDRPVGIKTYIEPVLSTYTYQYTRSGEYNIAFVAQNSTLKESKYVVKNMKIIIP